MEAFVVETPIGFFVVDGNLHVLGKAVSPSDPALTATDLKQIRSGKLPLNVLDMLRQAGSQYSPLIFEDEAIAKAAKEQAQLTVDVRRSEAPELFRSRLASEWTGREEWIRSEKLDSPLLVTARKYNEFVRSVTLQLAREAVTAAAGKRDLHAVQAVRALDDLDKTINLLAGRIREWFGLHFPEMDRMVEKHDTYARLVTKLGKRQNFTYENLQAEGLPKDRAVELADAAGRSMGSEFEDADLSMLRALCELTVNLYKFRERTEGYVADVLKQTAPNMTAIAGSALAARLISIAGSLQNLAKMPASTIQVLGAEKALFRSLKTGARPPKHGVIFQHILIHQSPRWQRGKIARTLAGKLSIASRIDAFGGDYIGEKLKKEVDEKVEGIKERYKEPPPLKKGSVAGKSQRR